MVKKANGTRGGWNRTNTALFCGVAVYLLLLENPYS